MMKIPFKKWCCVPILYKKITAMSIGETNPPYLAIGGICLRLIIVMNGGFSRNLGTIDALNCVPFFFCAREVNVG